MRTLGHREVINIVTLANYLSKKSIKPREPDSKVHDKDF